MVFPLLVSPLGWLALGAGGFVLYKVGKKKGEDERAAAKITAAPPEVKAAEKKEAPAKFQSTDQPEEQFAEKSENKAKKTNDSNSKTGKK